MLVGALAGGLTLEALLRYRCPAASRLRHSARGRSAGRGRRSAKPVPTASRARCRAATRRGASSRGRSRSSTGSIDTAFRAARGPTGASAPCRVLAIGDSHTFGYGVGAEQAWPAMLESMLTRVNVANAGICGSGIAAEQAWLPDALAAARAQVVVIAVTPWSLREDPEPPEQHELDARWPRAEAYLRRLTRYSAVADRTSRVLFQRTSALVGWPPPAPVLWELTPLVEPPAQFQARWAGVHARLARMVDVGPPARGDAARAVRAARRPGERRPERALSRRPPAVPHARLRRPRLHAATGATARARQDGDEAAVPFVDCDADAARARARGFLTTAITSRSRAMRHLAALLAAPVAEACAATPAIVRRPRRPACAGSVRDAAPLSAQHRQRGVRTTPVTGVRTKPMAWTGDRRDRQSGEAARIHRLEAAHLPQ
jgi:hypothetical protein